MHTTLSKRLYPLALAAAMLAAGTAVGQSSAFVATEQPLAALPAQVQTLYMIDGELHCHVAGVPMVAVMAGADVAGFRVDTALAAISPKAVYAQRHPSSGCLYLTVPNRKGVQRLYCYCPADKRPKLHEVVLQGFEDKALSIENPVFTADGTLMVFASNNAKGSGGYDLWYSELKQGQWQRPHNMGGRINTPADEVTPAICGPHLLFASSGHNGQNSAMNLYATRLISDQVVGDTVGMLQIGRSRVFRLPEPLNTEADSRCLLTDSTGSHCYWLAEGRLRAMHQPLQCVNLWGQVTDRQGNPLPGVTVSATEGTAVRCQAVTNLFGYYQLQLPAGHQYTVQGTKPGRFAVAEQVNTTVLDPEHVVTEHQLLLALDSLPLGQKLVFADLFDYDASPELSAHGRTSLQLLVDFLRCNPQLGATMTLTEGLTAEPAFNAQLGQSRLQTLRKYMEQALPADTKISFKLQSAGTLQAPDNAPRTQLAVVLTPTAAFKSDAAKR